MILTLLKIILAYVLPWVVGYLEARLLDPQDRFSAGYRFCAAYLLGIGSLTLQIFIAGVFGLKFNLGLFLGIVAFDIAFLEVLAFLRRKKFIIPRMPSWSRMRQGFSSLAVGNRVLLVVCVGIIALKVVAGFWQVTHTRVFEFDAWHNWNFRAKVIFTQHRLPLEQNADFYLGGGESSYPLHDALSKVWTATMVGGWHESAVDLYSVVYYALLVALFYFSLPAQLPFWARFLTTYLLASLPYLYFHSWVPYADLEFTTYLFLALSALFWFFTTAYRPYLYLSALALAGVIWTKNEGFAVVLPVMAASLLVGAFTKKLAKGELLRYGLCALLGASPWLVFRLLNRLDILSGGSSSFHLAFNQQFIADWFSTVFLRSNFNFLWLLFFFTVLVKAKVIIRRPPLLLLTSILLVLFLFYNGIILFTDKAYDLSALTRVNLHLTPFAAFLTILLFYGDVEYKNKKLG